MKDLIEKYHSKCRKATKDKLYNKLLRCRSKWSKDNNSSKDDIERLITLSLGSNCKYCGERIDVNNMGLDHKIPVNRGGSKSLDNLHIVCKRCNTRKGILTHSEYFDLQDFMQLKLPEEAQKYVYRKLSSRDMWGA